MRDLFVGVQKGAAAASSYALVDGALEARTSSAGNGRSEICWAVLTPDDRSIYGWSVEAEGALTPVGSWDGMPETVAGLAAS